MVRLFCILKHNKRSKIWTHFPVSHLADEVHAAGVADKVEDGGMLFLLVPLQLVLRHSAEVAVAAAPHLILEVNPFPAI